MQVTKRLRRNRGAVAASQHNTITPAFCLVSGNQEQTDADGRAPSQACDDSINSYAHSGTNRTAGEACIKSERLLLFRYLRQCFSSDRHDNHIWIHTRGLSREQVSSRHAINYVNYPIALRETINVHFPHHNKVWFPPLSAQRWRHTPVRWPFLPWPSPLCTRPSRRQARLTACHHLVSPFSSSAVSPLSAHTFCNSALKALLRFGAVK